MTHFLEVNMAAIDFHFDRLEVTFSMIRYFTYDWFSLNILMGIYR